MQFTVRMFGREVLAVSTESESPSPDSEWVGDCTTYSLGFVDQPGDQRWTEHPAPDLE